MSESMRSQLISQEGAQPAKGGVHSPSMSAGLSFTMTGQPPDPKGETSPTEEVPGVEVVDDVRYVGCRYEIAGSVKDGGIGHNKEMAEPGYTIDTPSGRQLRVQLVLSVAGAAAMVCPLTKQEQIELESLHEKVMQRLFRTVEHLSNQGPVGGTGTSSEEPSAQGGSTRYRRGKLVETSAVDAPDAVVPDAQYRALFDNDEIPLAVVADEVLVPVEAICEVLSVDLTRYWENLMRADELEQCMVWVSFSYEDGQTYDTPCLGLQMLPGLLAAIRPSMVPYSLRKKLRTYRANCFRTLWHHFYEYPVRQLDPQTRHRLNALRSTRDSALAVVKRYD